VLRYIHSSRILVSFLSPPPSLSLPCFFLPSLLEGVFSFRREPGCSDFLTFPSPKGFDVDLDFFKTSGELGLPVGNIAEPAPYGFC